MSVRPPAVAGTFYPGSERELRSMVGALLEAAAATPLAQPPRALVAPHAGYVYSGAVAASAFAVLAGHATEIERVVLLGPSHYVAFAGLALPGAAVEAFETPLGRVPLDRDAAAGLVGLEAVQGADAPHRREHSLEVELPFLQATLGEFRLVPLAVGEASPAAVAEVLERLAGARTLVVVSTDLSHYHPWQTARQLDARTAAAVEALRYEEIGDEDACGHVPLRGLLAWARQRGLSARRLDLRNSGDTAGPRDQVVGYGAWSLA